MFAAEVAKRVLEFSRKCLSIDSKLVSRVTYHVLLSACVISTFARNVFNCCSYFNTSTCNLWHLTPAYILKLYTLKKRTRGPNLHLMFKLHEIRSIGSQENH